VHVTLDVGGFFLRQSIVYAIFSILPGKRGGRKVGVLAEKRGATESDHLEQPYLCS